MQIRARAVPGIKALAAVACVAALAGQAAPAAAAVTASEAAAARPAVHTGSAHARRGGFGWLRLAHLSPNTPAVDVYLYAFGSARAMVVLRHVAYGTVSPYERVAAGEYTVAMRGVGAAPTSRPVLSTTVNVTARKAYTVAGMGPYKALRLQVMRDRLTAPPGEALVRVIQASLRQHRVTVTVGARQVADDLAFARMTAYRAIAPGARMLHADGGSERSADQTAFAAGSIHTVVVLDDPGHLAVRVLEDAAGATQAPAGGAATGFGGTARQPGPPLLPWISAAACGLLLAAIGLTRVRRRAPGRVPHGQARRLSHLSNRTR